MNKLNNAQMCEYLKANDCLLVSHPGELLQLEYLEEMGISAYRLAKDTGIDKMTVSRIINGTRKISLEAATRLGRYFQTNAQFWLNIQNNFESQYLEATMKDELAHIPLAAAH